MQATIYDIGQFNKLLGSEAGINDFLMEILTKTI
jgi:hypothetical protein